MPVAVRSTLNSAAFDVKKTTMPAKSAAQFKNRQPNFFKANSRVEMAKGLNVSSMRATVGFTSTSLKGENNYAVKDLEQQEEGGTIQKKSFIPMKQARGGSEDKPVLSRNRLSQIKNIVNAANMTGNTPRSKFVKAIIKAGTGGYVINANKYKKTLFRVKSASRPRMVEPLYSYREHRSVNVRSTGFMQDASIQSAGKMQKFFAIEAKKQINKALK